MFVHSLVPYMLTLWETGSTEADGLVCEHLVLSFELHDQSQIIFWCVDEDPPYKNLLF